MIFTYENRHQAFFKGCFSAFSNFVRAPICRFLVLGGCEPLAYAKVCLGLLVWGAYGHPRLFSAIRDTDSHRDYSTNKMDFTSMPALNCTHYSGQKDLHTLQKLDSACNADPHSWTGVFSDSFIMDTCISHRVSPA